MQNCLTFRIKIQIRRVRSFSTMTGYRRNSGVWLQRRAGQFLFNRLRKPPVQLAPRIKRPVGDIRLYCGA